MRTRIIGFLLLFSTNCFSQNTDSLLRNFDSSFYGAVRYPETLSKNCIPTITILRMDINQDGHIANMKLSDSADPLLNFEFITGMDKLNTSSIEEYAKIKSLKNITILIPIYYSFMDGHCHFPASRVSVLVKLMKFNGEDFRDQAVILPPIITLMGKAVE